MVFYDFIFFMGFMIIYSCFMAHNWYAYDDSPAGS